MAKFKFSHTYNDKELGRKVEAGETVDITVKRSKEIVKTVREFDGYEDFKSTRIKEDDVDE